MSDELLMEEGNDLLWIKHLGIVLEVTSCGGDAWFQSICNVEALLNTPLVKIREPNEYKLTIETVGGYVDITWRENGYYAGDIYIHKASPYYTEDGVWRKILQDYRFGKDEEGATNE